MTIEIKLVEKYDDEVFADLVKRNLETGIFIPDWKHRGNGDSEFVLEGRTIRIGAFDGDRLIGLSWGRSATKSRFVMHMSLVEPEYRRQGLYSRMLEMMLDLTRNYDEIDSNHQLFNNHIIAIKLRRGFYIVGIEQSIPMGPRLQLRYFNNPQLLDFMKFRVGLLPFEALDMSVRQKET